MAEISLSQGPPVISGESSKKHSKCIYCDDLERAVAHTSTKSNNEMDCTSLCRCLSKLMWFHFVKQSDASAKWKFY